MASAVQPNLKGEVRSRRATCLSHQAHTCLVAGPDRWRRWLLGVAATRAGWRTRWAQDPDQARAAVYRAKFQLALVDVTHESRHAWSGLCQTLAAEVPLLAVCNSTQDASAELWARQAGAWLYLPGLADADQITWLCTEAGQLSRRLGWRTAASCCGQP